MPHRTVAAIIHDLLGCRTDADVMDVVRHAVRRLVDADGATVIMRDGDFCYYADEDAIAPLWKGKRFPIDNCLSGWAMIHREQLAIRDIELDPRVPLDLYRPTFVRSLAMTPVRADNPIGAIGAYWAHVHDATRLELAKLRAIGDAAGEAFTQVRRSGRATA